MRMAPTRLTAAERTLQREVGEYLDVRLEPGTYPLGLGIAADSDPEFSRDLGEQGWLGMSLPVEYGGHGRSPVERLIVVEELLARGAPVGYHWVADRQSGPAIASVGTEEQKRRFLPGIARGELSFAIGMSEPQAGSDLAAVRTRAVPHEDGWLVNGLKIWTSGAATATHILALLRTSDDRHGGLTQFIIARDTPGVTVSPIPFIDGTSHFCEVHFDDAFVSDTRRLGKVGSGWSQNTSELALERGGVDRWMSVMPLLRHWADHATGATESVHVDLGVLAARAWALRGLSLSIARLVEQGQSPTLEAALVKDMATEFERQCMDVLVKYFGRTPALDSDDPHEALLARAVLTAPSWTIRGGTNEILRTIISKGLVKRG